MLYGKANATARQLVGVMNKAGGDPACPWWCILQSVDALACFDGGGYLFSPTL